MAASYAAAMRLSLPRLLEASAATGPGGGFTRAGAASRERGFCVAVDAGYMAYGLPLLRGLPDVRLALHPVQQWLTAASYYDSAIFVGDFSYDVEYMLHHLFKSRYPSAKSAKLIFDKLTGRQNAMPLFAWRYVNEHVQAISEMNGACCSTRPTWTGPHIYQPSFVQNTQGTDSYLDTNNSKLFIGYLDLMQAFSPYGDLVNVKVLAGKGCGLVTYSNRASAEEAMRMLKGSQMGGNTARLSWAHLSANKQDQQNGYYARLNCFDPSGSGWSLQFGSEGCGFFQLGNFSEDMMNDGQITFMGAGLVLKRGFSGTASGNGGLEKKLWQWIEQMYSKLFLEMAYDRPTGRMSRISICAVAYNAICQAFKDLYDLYLMLVYVASRYSPDSWDEPLRDARPFGESILQHNREERSLDFRGGGGGGGGG